MNVKPKKWRCFHCDAVFHSGTEAELHFGRSEGNAPICQIKSWEGNLAGYIRKLEAQLASYQADDSAVLRAVYAARAEHEQALRAAEETGYDRGVRDARQEASRC